MEKHKDPNITDEAKKRFFQEVKNDSFGNAPADSIADILLGELVIPEFHNYLKRYIAKKMNRLDTYASIEDEEYIQYVLQSFTKNGTPASFVPGTTLLRAAVKNCLTHKTVDRETVFLLGLGLGMRADEVNEFLTKALYEPEINAKDPFEVVCWYCFEFCSEEQPHYPLYK